MVQISPFSYYQTVKIPIALKQILIILLSWWLVLTLSAWLVSAQNLNYWLSWANWDGGHFRGIAEHSYQDWQVVFFPLYPILIKASMFIGLDSLSSGLIISYLAFLLAIYFLYRLVRLDFPSVIAKQTVWFLLIFPAAFYLISVYSESLFLALSLGAAYYARKQQWILAAGLAGLTAVTRSFGIATIALVIVEYLSINPINLKTLGRSLFLTSYMLWPLFCFSLFLLSWQGESLAFISYQQMWQRQLSWPWQTILNNTDPRIMIWDVIALVMFLIGLFWGYRHLRPSYWIYYLMVWLLPLFSGTISSLTRYYLIIWPFFLLLALTDNRLLKIIWSIISISGLIYLLGLFISQQWVS